MIILEMMEDSPAEETLTEVMSMVMLTALMMVLTIEDTTETTEADMTQDTVTLTDTDQHTTEEQ